MVQRLFAHKLKTEVEAERSMKIMKELLAEPVKEEPVFKSAELQQHFVRSTCSTASHSGSSTAAGAEYNCDHDAVSLSGSMSGVPQTHEHQFTQAASSADVPSASALRHAFRYGHWTTARASIQAAINLMVSLCLWYRRSLDVDGAGYISEQQLVSMLRKHDMFLSQREVEVSKLESNSMCAVC